MTVIGRRRVLTVLAVVTVAWVLLLTTWALFTPFFGAVGETESVDAAFRWALGGGWPAPGSMHQLAVTQWLAGNATALPAADRSTVAELLAAHPGETGTLNTTSQHPPTYYLFLGLALRALHWGALRWDEAVLALRFVDVLLLAPLPALVWATARRLVRSPAVALAAPVLLFAVPKLAQSGGSVSIWVPMTLVGAVLVWLAARVLTGDRSWWTTIGLVVTAVAAAALTALGLIALVFAIVVLVVGPLAAAVPTSTDTVAGDRPAPDVPGRRAPSRRWIDAGIALVAALAVGAVLWRSTVRTGWVPDAAPQPSPLPDAGPDGINFGEFLNQQWKAGGASFWGMLGDNQFWLSPAVVAGLTVVAGGVLLWAAVRGAAWLRPTWWLLLWPALVIVASLVYSWRNAVLDHSVHATNGRFLHPAVAALVVAVAVAASEVVEGRRGRRALAIVATVGALLVTVHGFAIAYEGIAEGGHLRVSADGLRTMSAAAPLGAKVSVVAAALLALAAVALVVAVALLARGPRRRPTDDRTSVPPATGAPGPAPLDSPPTVEPTQRNTL